MTFENAVLAVVFGVITIVILKKIWTRLQLSRAKHPSLRGHSKWSRRIARQIPFFEYDKPQFFCSDGAPEEIVSKRRQGFAQVREQLLVQNPQSIEFTQSLEDSVSDVNFTNAYRVPFPFRNEVRETLPVGNVVEESRGVELRDIDGNWTYDLSGSYGVNVFGYDFYKECMDSAWNRVKQLGPVLGPYHPLIQGNVERLKKISGLDEVSFHMSGTEAVMQAVRLARYHTRKSHLVRLCGAYHGWWDGVQPGIGNQRKTNDVYTLSDMSEQTLKVLRTRNDIACVLINPLQGLHPNSDASSDASLISNGRSAKFDRQAYSAWLQKIRKVCDERGIVLIFDEVFTGFRLAYRGAQEYFNVQADIVTYGKTLGGGLPVGVVCGRATLMKRYRDNRPVDVSFARGTFNSHPMVIASMHEFLNRVEQEEYQEMYQQSESVWNRRADLLNQRFEQSGLPLRVENLMSIWTLIYTQPSRYHWMYQFYLRLAGLTLSWVGTGRFIFSHNYSDDDFEQVCERFIEAGEKMELDGWWWISPQLNNKYIKRRMTHEMMIARFPWMKKILKPEDQTCQLGNEAESA